MPLKLPNLDARVIGTPSAVGMQEWRICAHALWPAPYDLRVLAMDSADRYVATAMSRMSVKRSSEPHCYENASARAHILSPQPDDNFVAGSEAIPIRVQLGDGGTGTDTIEARPPLSRTVSATCRVGCNGIAASRHSPGRDCCRCCALT